MKLALFLIGLIMFVLGCPSTHYDILIRNGTVVDGSGSKGYISDIGIKDGKILMIGDNISGDSSSEIDASGLIVAPGFIDILSRAHRI